MTDERKRLLKDKLLKDIDGLIDVFFDDFSLACGEAGGVPTLSEIERLVGALDDSSRAAYSELIHGAIGTLDTGDMIASKKAG